MIYRDLLFLVLLCHLDVTRIGCPRQLDTLLAVVAHSFHEILAQVFRLLSCDHLSDNRHVHALFVRDTRGRKVYVYQSCSSGILAAMFH